MRFSKNNIWFSLVMGISMACNSAPERTVYDVEYTSSVADSIVIPCNNSGEGLFKLLNDSIYYIDRNYCTITSLNQTTRQSNTFLGIADTTLKLQRLDDVVFNKGNYYLFDGKTFSITNSKFDVVKHDTLKFYSNQSRLQFEMFPRADNIAIYEPHFFKPNVFVNAGTIYVSVDTEHSLFNAYSNRDYYSKGYCYALVAPFTMNVKTLDVKRSGIYLQKENLPFFNGHFGIPLSEGFAITFEADSLIQISNPRNDNLVQIGLQPRRFNSNYSTYQTIDVAFDTKQFDSDRQKFGRYISLLFDKETNRLLRYYYSGLDEKGDVVFGLQLFDLYRNTLTAELPIRSGLMPIKLTGNSLLCGRIKNENEIALYNLKFQ
jgi:hypothetical protein